EPAQPHRPGGVHQRERLFAVLALPEELRRGADSAEVAAAENDLHRHSSYVCENQARYRTEEEVTCRSSYPHYPTTTPRWSRTSTRARWRSTTASTTRRTWTTRTRRSTAPSGPTAPSRTC